MELDWAREMIEQYGYLAVFISTVIEGEAVVLAAAALTASGMLEWPWVVISAALGAFVGHLLFFIIGRWRGMQLIEAVPMLRRHYPKANLLMDEYAHWSIFMFQYLYGLRLASAIMFGSSSIGFVRFALLQTINCLSWALVIFFAGRIIGILTLFIHDTLGMSGVIVIGSIGAVTLFVLYRRYIHHHLESFLFHGQPKVEQLQVREGRAHIDQHLPYLISLAERQGQPLSLLLIAVPKKLKSRDSFEVLAHEVCVRLRNTDIAGRINDHTLAVIAPGSKHKGTRMLQARLLRAARHRLPGTVGCMLAWQEGVDAEGLMREANEMLEEEWQKRHPGRPLYQRS